MQGRSQEKSTFSGAGMRTGGTEREGVPGEGGQKDIEGFAPG